MSQPLTAEDLLTSPDDNHAAKLALVKSLLDNTLAHYELVLEQALDNPPWKS